MLVGHNPLGQVLQIWDNANTLYPLVFKVHTENIGFTLSWGHVTITDPDFYAVVGVTIQAGYSETFNDYGSQGAISVSGTFDVPCWPAMFNGPDPTNSASWQNQPYAYFWQPGVSGNTVYLPYYGFGDGAIVNVYYAALSPAAFAFSKANIGKGGADNPLAALRLTWEPQLGDGPEYGVAYASEQIIYPFFAGLGSPNIDLGASGAIPNINPEIWGSFPLHPDTSLDTAGGDADFADMITDIFCSGPAQAGLDGELGLTAVQHGLNCNDFPGIVQKKLTFNTTRTSGAATYQFDAPVTEGSYLVAAFRYNTAASGPTLDFDSLGNTWTPILAYSPAGGVFTYAWYTKTIAGGLCEIQFTTPGANQAELQLFEVAGFDTLEEVVPVTGSSTTVSVELTSTTQRTLPGLFLTWFDIQGTGGDALTPTPRWEEVMTAGPGSGGEGYSETRKVWGPATYSATHQQFASGTNPWAGFGLAFKNTNVPQYPVSLGNILEQTTLANARLGAWAGGLWGSININSARKAQELLADLFDSMNAAPVWSGFKLKSIAWSEASAAANGAVFIAPTASGPIASLTPADFIGDSNTRPPEVSSVSAIRRAADLVDPAWRPRKQLQHKCSPRNRTRRASLCSAFGKHHP